MNKNDFVNLMAGKTKMSKAQIQEVTNAFMLVITESMIKGENISFIGFGSFQPVQQQERVARNPKTGEPVTIKARSTVKFKPGKNLIAQMNPVK